MTAHTDGNIRTEHRRKRKIDAAKILFPLPRFLEEYPKSPWQVTSSPLNVSIHTYVQGLHHFDASKHRWSLRLFFIVNY